MRLYVYSGKWILAAIYPRRTGIKSRSYAAAPTQVSKVVTPPGPREVPFLVPPKYQILSSVGR
jgi:hypothetical protein